MSELTPYKIAHNSLNTGFHDYDYQLDSEFFKLFDHEYLKNGALRAEVNVERKENHTFVLKFSIRGTVEVQCDRCLEFFDFPVAYAEELFIKFGTSYYEEAENVLILPESDPYINLADFMFEFIVVSLPVKKVHPEDGVGCNPEMLKTIEAYSIVNEDKGTDPRWNELKKLLN